MQHIFNIIASFLAHLSGQASTRCEYYQNVSIGETYYIHSPNYPDNYNPGTTCRWTATCPENYNCQLNCSEILLPSSPDCSTDKLLFSSSRDDEMEDTVVYCGNETTVIVSEEQTITAGLDVSRSSPGGKFICSLTAVPVADTRAKKPCSCGRKKMNRIVGGTVTKVNEYPMMAGIRTSSSKEIFCGAVIIHKRYLLTAAHCFINVKTKDLLVVVGEQDYNIKDSPATKNYSIAETIIHREYNKSVPNSDNDIAIVITRKMMKFDDRVGPVCLPFKFVRKTFTGNAVTALGWGNLGFGGNKTTTLRKVDLNVISNEICRDAGVAASPTRICTYTQGKDTCQRDSGGPLLYTDPSSGILYNVGIASIGQFCAGNTPVANTRVTEFVEWIKKQTPGTVYCQN